MRIVYVDVDSLRADHTQPYGYARPTTPSLQELAERSVVFDRFYCSDSPCLPSRMAWASGQFGVVNGVVAHFGEGARFRLEAGYPARPTRPLLGQWLRAHGYYTASVSMFADRHGAYAFLGNFRESIRASEETNDEDARDVNRVAQDWLRRHGRDDNWFLHVNYWEPHTPYLISAEWVERAAESGPSPPWPDEAAVREHAEIYGPRSALDLHYTGVPNSSSPVPHSMPDAVRSREDVVALMNGYDAAVMYWDEHLGAVLRTLEELGIADETAVIVSGDHGESLGENGSYAEHGLANEPTHRLPLVVSWPGITDVADPGARRCDALLYNIDVGPTLCDLLGLPVPVGWHGTSFADAVRGDAIASRPYLVFGQGAHTYQRAVRTRDHLYIRTLPPGLLSRRLGVAVRRQQRPASDAEPHRERARTRQRDACAARRVVDGVRRPPRGSPGSDADDSADRTDVLQRPLAVRAASAQHRARTPRRGPRATATRDDARRARLTAADDTATVASFCDE